MTNLAEFAARHKALTHEMKQVYLRLEHPHNSVEVSAALVELNERIGELQRDVIGKLLIIDLPDAEDSQCVSSTPVCRR